MLPDFWLIPDPLIGLAIGTNQFSINGIQGSSQSVSSNSPVMVHHKANTSKAQGIVLK